MKPKLVMSVQQRGTSDWCISSDPLSCAQHLPSPRIYLQINEGIGGQKKSSACWVLCWGVDTVVEQVLSLAKVMENGIMCEI